MAPEQEPRNSGCLSAVSADAGCVCATAGGATADQKQDRNQTQPRGRGRQPTAFHSRIVHKSAECHIVRPMAVDPELLEILACPNCKTPVILVKNGAALKCGTCKRVYPIKDDIPVMLIDEATIED